jgi:hypothetical protein
VLFYLYPVWSKAQTVDFSGKDSVSVTENPLIQADTVRIDSLVNAKIKLEPVKFKPNPTKAVLYSAILPGLGQIYNRKYWKLPLVYGAFMGCTYAIIWNGTQYNGYQNAYKDFISVDSKEDRWMDYLYGAYTKDTAKWTGNMKTNFRNSLKSGRDYYRRYRDLSIIITVGVYALSIIDAYVDAQLYEFDVSPDLSMRIEPVLFDCMPGGNRSFGMQLSFAF